MPSFPSLEPKVSCFDDLDLFKDFENEFLAIVYNDALTSKSYFLTEPTLSPQHIDESDLKDETSLSEYDEVEQNGKLVSKNGYDILEIVHDFEDRLETIIGRQVNRVRVLDFEGLTPEMRQDLAERLWMAYTGDDGHDIFMSHTWRMLFKIRAPLVREFILEFFSTCRIGSEIGLDVADSLCFQLGGARRSMTWRQFILAPGLHTTEEMAEDGFDAYWFGSERVIPDKGDEMTGLGSSGHVEAAVVVVAAPGGVNDALDIDEISNVPDLIPDHLRLLGLTLPRSNNVFDYTVGEKRMGLTYLSQLMKDHSIWERLGKHLLMVKKVPFIKVQNDLESILTYHQKIRRGITLTFGQLLQRLPKDIYTLINNYTDAKDIWDNVKMLLGTHETGNGGPQNRDGNVNLGQARQIKCYNYNGIGHIASNCTQPKRPQNSKYFKDKMLLMQAQENGIVLDEKQLLFIAGGQDNVVDKDVDEPPAPTAQTMFMKSLSSADPVYDEAGPSYDSNILYEVHDHDNYQDAICELHEVYEMHDNVRPNCIFDSDNESTSDSYMIPYDQITLTGLTEGERGFEQTKECYLTEVIPFFKTLKEHFEGFKKALTKEIKEMKDFFKELDAEVDQNAVNRKCDEIERKNLLITNNNLIADCLSKEVFYIATNSNLTTSSFTKMHDAHIVVQARCLEIEAKLSKLNDKIKKYDHNELVKCFSSLD
uniref:Retrovirus-related Pol polyprotein from transposon TNT 1-94 n=1 Tax=Tanacetum cinerariifolium TaxID=118510 RepID=A0A699GZP8_TANCI|nr:hypothetical protein [Tanacetum cinerariifolium]